MARPRKIVEEAVAAPVPVEEIVIPAPKVGMETILIVMAEGDNQKTVEVTINGERHVIEKGLHVEVSSSVADVLRNAKLI